MRKVLFKKWIPAQYEEGSTGISRKKLVEGTGCFGEMTSQGVFHCWGNAYEEFETGAGNYSVALVETSNGSIFEVLPCHLIFV